MCMCTLSHITCLKFIRIGECIEGYYGVLPESLEKEVDVIKEISMRHIIAVWKQIVHFQSVHQNSTTTNNM